MRLIVPMTAQVVRRRNYILDRMKTLSVLTQGHAQRGRVRGREGRAGHPGATGRAAAGAPPHFVWQVRDELGQILCGTAADDCEQIDKGGYQVLTTLDYRMQRIVEKWVYAAADHPEPQSPDARLRDRKIPRREWGWIKSLRGHNIHNAAAGVHRLPHRRGARVRRLGVVQRQGQPASSSPGSTSSAMAGASRARRSSRSSTRSGSRTGR